MRFLQLKSLLSTLLVAGSVLTQSVDDYITKQKPISKAGLLANIGPSGSRSSGARAGVVIASPSTVDPDYLYTWIRDASLVLQDVINEFTQGRDTSLRGHIDNFVRSQAKIQQVSNPSGSISTGGLGEPKFHIDETAFTGGWGRPQRDGPALRANALITWATWLLDNGNSTYVTSSLWPIIKLDLDYVANTWNQSTFDLWEEVSSSSYFTTAVQHKSLRLGVRLANRIGQTGVVSLYTAQATNTLCFLQSYWNPTRGFVTSNTGGGRSGIDSNSVLTSIHTFDPEAGCDSVTLQPCSDRALSNLKVYVDAFRSIYRINSGIASNAAVATGRYAEDVYYNGNPWYLTTFAVAEQLYDALIVWNKQGSLQVTATSQAFFRSFDSSVNPGTYASSTTTFKALTAAVKNFADGFVAVAAKYTPADGSLAEQFTRDAGTPISARHLTWSYASSLTAFNARAGVVPASWGAKGLTSPTTCTGFSGPTVTVNFRVRAETVLGENIYITGSVVQLKSWSPNDALILSANSYPIWTITVTLPANSLIEYKYIRKNNGQVTWQSDPNNSFSTPASGTVTRDDTWR